MSSIDVKQYIKLISFFFLIFWMWENIFPYFIHIALIPTVFFWDQKGFTTKKSLESGDLI